MMDSLGRRDIHDWEHKDPQEVLAALVYELYHPVSLLGSQLNRLTEDETPLTEEEYEAIFEQMQGAVRQLSKTVVALKRYAQDHPSIPAPDPTQEQDPFSPLPDAPEA